MQDQQDMLDLSLSISERMLQYTTQLEGITALIVIPVILYMFHRDRKNERLAGVIPNRKAPLWKYGAVAGIAAALCVGLNDLILISGISSYSASYSRPPTLSTVLPSECSSSVWESWSPFRRS